MDWEAAKELATVMLWVVVPIMAIVFLGFKAEGIKEAFKGTLLVGGLMFVVGSVFWAVVFVATGTPTRTFGGYECTDNCSGHKAGYKWAEAKGITDEEQM
jgi:hypothetical protein